MASGLLVYTQSVDGARVGELRRGPDSLAPVGVVASALRAARHRGETDVQVRARHVNWSNGWGSSAVAG